jgi:hypothetical protein
MSWKRVCPCALVLTLLGLGAAQAQYAAAPPSGPPAPAAASAEPPAGNPQAPGMLSDWILYRQRCNCCGPVGGHGPIGTELYVRSGISLPVEGPFFGHTLETGWVIEGGGRVLFFNPEADRAWVVDMSLSNVNNHGQRADRAAILKNIIVPTAPVIAGAQPGTARIPLLAVTVEDYNRTFVNAALGREWFLMGGPGACPGGCASGDCGGGNCLYSWKAGFDAGYRYGSAKLELNEIRHRTKQVLGPFAALHTEIERNCGCCCTWFAGVRLEWDYTNTHILQGQNDAHLEDVNFLFTLGVRY